MVTYQDHKEYRNAETTIDYDKQKVSFKYVDKLGFKERYAAYEQNTFYFVLSILLGLFIGFLVLRNYTTKYLDETNIILQTIILLALTSYASYKYMGIASNIIHTLSPTAHKNFPKTNTFLLNLRQPKKVDLSKGKYQLVGETEQPNIIINNKKLIITDYSIGLMNYSYIGTNKIRKIQTKKVYTTDYTEPHPFYVAIFTFQNKIRDGILLYK